MGNGLNVRRVTGYQARSERKNLRQISIQKVRLNPLKKFSEAGSVALTKKSLKRIKMMPERKDAVLRALENEEEARDMIVNQHQLLSLKSNPTANVSLTKKQMKKLKSRARASGLLAKTTSMEL